MRVYIVGLGNPPELYSWTRHNVGYHFVEFVARKEELKFKPAKGHYFIAKDEKKALVLPALFMNESGIAVKELLENEKVKPKNLLIVLDDANLEFGQLRLRLKGSSGGHKGLESVIYQIGSEEIPRLRIGIGKNPDGMSLKDYVLSKFTKEEIEELKKEVFERAYRGLLVYINEGPEKAMSILNRRREVWQ